LDPTWFPNTINKVPSLIKDAYKIENSNIQEIVDESIRNVGTFTYHLTKMVQAAPRAVALATVENFQQIFNYIIEGFKKK